MTKLRIGVTESGFVGHTCVDAAHKLTLTEPLAVAGKAVPMENLMTTVVLEYDRSDARHPNALVVRHHPSTARPGFQ